MNYIQNIVEFVDEFYNSGDIEGLKIIDNLAIHCLKNTIKDAKSDFVALSEYTEFALKALETKDEIYNQSAKKSRQTIEDDLKR